MDAKIIEKALRNKYRFPSASGQLLLEQLWDLPLQSLRGGKTDLDNVARGIAQELREQQEDSFVMSRPSPRKTELAEKLAIVVYIIDTKQAENAEAAAAAQKRAERNRLTEILHMRTQDDLMKKTPAEIEAMIAALDNPPAPATSA